MKAQVIYDMGFYCAPISTTEFDECAAFQLKKLFEPLYIVTAVQFPAPQLHADNIMLSKE